MKLEGILFEIFEEEAYTIVEEGEKDVTTW